VSDIKAEWCAFFFSLSRHITDLFLCHRLIELAANYFDLDSFPDGAIKEALKRAWTKRAGKDIGRQDGSDAKRPNKKKRI
jgi:hypothetical protein